MKKLLLSFLVMIGLASVGTTAQAAFYIEPFLGYQIGWADTNTNIMNDYTHSAPVFGGRVGYGALGLSAGLDTSFSSFKLQQDFGSKAKTKYDGRSFGIFVSYKLPVLIRVWGTYHFSAAWEDKGDNEFQGNGVSLGVSFTGLPFIFVNLEYRSLNFDKWEPKNGGKIKTDMDDSSLILSVSLPLSF